MILLLALSLVATLVLAIGLKRLFSRFPNWLIVAGASLLPPFIMVPYRIYRSLVEIGRFEAQHGQAPPDMVDTFAATVQSSLLAGLVSIILGVLVCLVTLRFLDSREL